MVLAGVSVTRRAERDTATALIAADSSSTVKVKADAAGLRPVLPSGSWLRAMTTVVPAAGIVAETGRGAGSVTVEPLLTRKLLKLRASRPAGDCSAAASSPLVGSA